MTKTIKILLPLAVLLLIMAVIALIFATQLVDALPGQIRARLPEEIVKAVTTPLPTALPAPQMTPYAVDFAIGVIDLDPTTEPAATTTGVANISRNETPTHPPFKTTAQASREKPTGMSAAPAATRILAIATPAARLPATLRLEGLTVAPQKLNNCGPTTLSINLNYYGLETTQFDVAGVVKPHYDDRNVSPEELVAFTNEHTALGAAVFRGGDLQLLKQLIAAGYPVVVEKGYEPNDWQGWMGHYLTLFGYDDAAGTFLTMDTFLGPWDSSGREYTYAEIEETWHQFNNTFFVVYPPAEERAIATILGPAFNDPLTMWQQAASKAQKHIETQGDDPFAWFNLGSSLIAIAALTGDAQAEANAAAAFDQARLLGLPHRMLWYQFGPYEAYLATDRFDEVLLLTETILENPGGADVEETYFYRGMALRGLGEEQEALAAFRRALAIKPQYTAAQGALINAGAAR